MKAAFSFPDRNTGRVIVPSISSDATTADERGLVCRIARGIAAARPLATYRSDILAHRPRPSLKLQENRAARQEVLRGAFYLPDPSVDLSDTVVLVVDDFVTNGDTMREIARVLRAGSRPPRRIFGVCLAKNERQRWAESRGHTLSNRHIAPTHTALWSVTARRET